MDVGDVMDGSYLGDQNDDDGFIINLLQNHGQVAHVASVEFLMTDIRNQYSFGGNRTINDIFSDTVAAQISAALSDVKSGEQMVCLPDFEIVTSGVIISGLRILISYLDNGVATITMRFKRYVGAIKSMFKFDPAMSLDSATMREKIAVEVLKDIVTPLLDVLSFAESASPDDLHRNRTSIENRFEKLSSRAKEISFYTSLLQRYVAGCKADIEQKRNVIENLEGAIQ